MVILAAGRLLRALLRGGRTGCSPDWLPRLDRPGDCRRRWLEGGVVASTRFLQAPPLVVSPHSCSFCWSAPASSSPLRHPRTTGGTRSTLSSTSSVRRRTLPRSDDRAVAAWSGAVGCLRSDARSSQGASASASNEGTDAGDRAVGAGSRRRRAQGVQNGAARTRSDRDDGPRPNVDAVAEPLPADRAGARAARPGGGGVDTVRAVEPAGGATAGVEARPLREGRAGLRQPAARRVGAPRGAGRSRRDDAASPTIGHRAAAPGRARAHDRGQGLPGRGEPRVAALAARRQRRRAVLPVVDGAGEPARPRHRVPRPRRHPGPRGPPPRRPRASRGRRPRRLPAVLAARDRRRRPRRPALDAGSTPVHPERRPGALGARSSRVGEDDRAVEGGRGAQRAARAVPDVVSGADGRRRGAFPGVRPG